MKFNSIFLSVFTLSLLFSNVTSYGMEAGASAFGGGDVVDLNKIAGLKTAVKDRNIKQVKALLSNPAWLTMLADINHPSSNGNTALIIAAQNKYAWDDATTPLEIVRALLDVPSIYINHANNDDNTALMEAIKSKNSDILRALLDRHEIDINRANKAGNTALMEAINNRNAEAVRALLDRHEINVNHVNKDGNTAFMLAIINNGDDDIFRFLVDRSNVNHVNKDGDTALMLAINNEDADAVEVLLAMPGINVNHANNNDDTAITLAVEREDLAMVEALLDEGAEIRDKDIEKASTEEIRDFLRKKRGMLTKAARAGAGRPKTGPNPKEDDEDSAGSASGAVSASGGGY